MKPESRNSPAVWRRKMVPAAASGVIREIARRKMALANTLYNGRIRVKR